MKDMKKYILFLLTSLLWVSCLDKDIHVADPIVDPIQKVDYTIDGNDLVFTWAHPSATMTIYITPYINGTLGQIEEKENNSYAFENVESDKNYTFVFKLRDKEGNLSTGTIVKYPQANS